jgi:ABC-type transport system substrate-binding protein
LTTRRLLLLVPLALAIVLLQSYFWVPSYDQQARGNPGRLAQFINASIGDASILNPILSSDSASSEIENLVFEGLIDRDENLRFRGRVAASWRITAEAYFYPEAASSGGGAPGPQGAVERLEAARQPGPLRAELPEAVRRTVDDIAELAVLAPRSLRLSRKIAAAGRPPETVTLTVSEPARIKLTLNRVDPDLFTHLEAILGKGAFGAHRPRRFVEAAPPLPEHELAALAQEVLPATEHNPVIEFRLRPGVRFHDGHPVEASDVKFTYEAIMDPRNLSPRVSDYEPVKEVQVLDPLTLRVVYKRLYSPAINSWAMGILPEHLLNAEALRREAEGAGADPAGYGMRQSAFNRRPVGSGPFVFREWVSDQHIALDRFEGYWEGPPNYRAYVFRVIPDLLTQEMEFYAGTVDAYDVAPHQVGRLRNDPRFQSFSGTRYSYAYIGYNMRRKPFDDVRVRRALGMAIDVEPIIRHVLSGEAERTTGPFPRQTAFYDPRVAPVPYDPEAALALMAEAGWRRNPQGLLSKNGEILRFTLITNSGNDTRKAILAIAQDAWRRIGVDVRTDILEWSVFIKERVNKADFDAVVLGWSTGIDPDVYQVWHSSQSGPHQLNFVGYRNPQADDLIARIREEYDEAAQIELCHRLHAVIAADQPYTFLYVPKWTAVLDRRIVIRDTDPEGQAIYRPITSTITGNYMFYFNRWIKLAETPRFDP